MMTAREIDRGLNEALLKFEASWQSGSVPNIDAYWRHGDSGQGTGDGADSSGSDDSWNWLLELVLVDLEYRWRASEAEHETKLLSDSSSIPFQPLVENYLARYPELRSRRELLSQLVAEEYRVRSSHGDQPSPQSYVGRFATELPNVLEMLSATDREIELEHSATGSSNSRENSDAPTQMRTGRQASAVDRLNVQFGDYELLDEIARGGMGVVYKARQIKADRIVALKMILSGIQSKSVKEDEVKRFQTEVESAANLDHPGIVPVYDVGEVNGQHYFSMGYVEGRSLKDRIKRSLFSSREAAELVKSIAEAIAHAHQSGVVHRDLKPANVLLDLDGKPKVTDFGLARRIKGGSDLTVSGQIMGTPAYMAPEQAAGRNNEVQEAADIYALGVILYEMLTGQPPFQSNDVFEVLEQVQDADPKSPRELVSSIDLDLETICQKCLEKEPAKRYPSARELVAELTRYLNGEPIDARPIGKIGRTWRWCQRNPLVASSGSLSVVAIAAVLIVSFATDPSQELTERDTLRTAEIRKLYEDPDVLIGKLKSHIRSRAKSEIDNIRKTKGDWRKIDEIEKRRDAALERVEDLVTTIREGLAGNPDPIFAEAARILADEGVDASLEYLDLKEPEIEKKVDRLERIRDDAEENLRDALQSWLLKADLFRTNLKFTQAKSILKRIVGKTPKWSRVHRELGSLLHELAEFDAAQLEFKAAVTLAEDESARIRATGNLAISYIEQANYALAEPLLRSNVSRGMQSNGDDLPNIASDINDLASVLHATNRLSEAEPLMRTGLVLDEQTYGPNHHVVAVDLNNLAQLLYDRGRWLEAEFLMRRALAIEEHEYGPQHPNVARRLDGLAVLLQVTQRTAKADALLRHALAIDERSYGIDHPNVAISLNNLAQVLHDKNQFVEAEPLMRLALEIDERSYKMIHPNTSTCLNNLAQLLLATDRINEAELLMRSVIAIDEQCYDHQHPIVATGLNNLASLLQDTDYPKEAECLMRHALTIDEKSYGAAHPDVARDLNNLASLLQDTGRVKESEVLMRRALSINEQCFGSNHREVARAVGNLATLLYDTNRLAEAETLMRLTIAIYETAISPDHPRVAGALSNLAMLLQKTDRLAEAEPLLRRVLVISLQSYEPDHSEIADSLSRFAVLLLKTNRLSQAEVLMRRALEIDENAFGPEDSAVAIDLNNLANVLFRMGRLEEAELAMRRALEIFVLESHNLGQEHPALARMQASYTRLLQSLKLNQASQQKKLAHFEQVASPLSQILPEIERLLGKPTPIEDVLAALDEHYKQQNKPAIYLLPIRSPIASQLNKLLGPEKLTFEKGATIADEVDRLLGPTEFDVPTVDPISPHLTKLLGPKLIVLGTSEPIARQLDRLLGVSQLNLQDGASIARQVDRLLGPTRFVFDRSQSIATQVDRLLGTQQKTLSLGEPVVAQMNKMLGPMKLDVPLDQPVGPYLDNLLGPAVAPAMAIAQDSLRQLNGLLEDGQREKCRELMNELLNKHNDNAQLLNAIAWQVATNKLPGDLSLAIDAARRAVELTKEQDPASLDTLARVHFEKNNINEAIKWQAKAVCVAPPRTRHEFEEVLQKYKTQAPR